MPDSTSSQIAEKMGAKITLTGPGQGMYLVIGDSIPIENVIRQYNGKIVMELSFSACLALLEFDIYMKLKQRSGIKKIGPVSVDIDRFNRSIETLTKKLHTP